MGEEPVLRWHLADETLALDMAVVVVGVVVVVVAAAGDHPLEADRPMMTIALLADSGKSVQQKLHLSLSCCLPL